MLVLLLSVSYVAATPKSPANWGGMSNANLVEFEFATSLSVRACVIFFFSFSGHNQSIQYQHESLGDAVCTPVRHSLISTATSTSDSGFSTTSIYLRLEPCSSSPFGTATMQVGPILFPNVITLGYFMTFAFEFFCMIAEKHIMV